jgi:hypothetical protein
MGCCARSRRRPSRECPGGLKVLLGLLDGKLLGADSLGRDTPLHLVELCLGRGDRGVGLGDSSSRPFSSPEARCRALSASTWAWATFSGRAADWSDCVRAAAALALAFAWSTFS